MNKKNQSAEGHPTPSAPIMKTSELEGKDKDFARQYQIVFKAFSEKPKTMAQVESETGVWRTNITRYVATMKREGSILLIRKDVCPITGMSGVGFYQTVSDISPAPYIATPSVELYRSARHASMSSAQAEDFDSKPSAKPVQCNFLNLYEQVQK